VAKTDVVDQTADELYGLPPGEFTSARDARVKELRADGDRDAATAVKALRKPTVAAWSLNQLSRRRADDVERLLAAGEELRSAQEELLAGGDRSAFQEAAAAERDLVAGLAEDATTMASEVGERGAGLREKVAETLHAAALDEETAEALRAGRLTREREAVGGFGSAAVAAPSTPSPARTTSPSPARPAKKAPRRSKQPAAEAKASRAAAEARQRLAAARTDERHARRELDAAARAVEHAEERAQAAEAAAADANERAKTTAERLREAKKAESAARKAHTRATRALESAERAAS
jgi:hypothetical protein